MVGRLRQETEGDHGTGHVWECYGRRHTTDKGNGREQLERKGVRGKCLQSGTSKAWTESLEPRGKEVHIPIWGALSLLQPQLPAKTEPGRTEFLSSMNKTWSTVLVPSTWVPAAGSPRSRETGRQADRKRGSSRCKLTPSESPCRSKIFF